jgi:hypothetical protein
LLPAPSLAYSSTLKMEVKCSSKTLVDVQQVTWHYITGDRTLQREHTKSNANNNKRKTSWKNIWVSILYSSAFLVHIQELPGPNFMQYNALLQSLQANSGTIHWNKQWPLPNNS